jgi:hypothetical protein
MRRLPLAGVAIAAILALDAFGAVAASASQKHSGRGRSVGACGARHKNAVAVGTQAIVYATRGGSGSGAGSLTTYFACTPPAGKPVAVGQSEEGEEYPGELSFSNVRIAGTYVAGLSGSGFGSASACSKYATGAHCEEEVKWRVQVANVKTRGQLRVSAGVTEAGKPTAVAVSSAGALAWVQPVSSTTAMVRALVLHGGPRGRLTGTVQTLETGAIGKSLQFSGLTLRWTSSGQPKSQALG